MNSGRERILNLTYTETQKPRGSKFCLPNLLLLLIIYILIFKQYFMLNSIEVMKAL